MSNKEVLASNLLRQLVSGTNVLREKKVFPCNQTEHNRDCECFWEQCEAWAAVDYQIPQRASITPLLQKIVEICDEGSTREFDDADERLRAIRGLIIGEAV